MINKSEFGDNLTVSDINDHYISGNSDVAIRPQPYIRFLNNHRYIILTILIFLTTAMGYYVSTLSIFKCENPYYNYIEIYRA